MCIFITFNLDEDKKSKCNCFFSRAYASSETGTSFYISPQLVKNDGF